VNTHQNARLTVWGRAEAVRRLLQDGEPVALVATALHVSPRMLYKWRSRFLTEGPVGLPDPLPRIIRLPA
jgi:transposase-like protein